MKSERRKQRYTVTLFDCNQLAQVIVLWHIKKMCYCTIFALFTLRAISKYKPPGALIWEGDLTEGILRYEVWKAYIWRGLFSEFYGFWGNLRAKHVKRNARKTWTHFGALVNLFPRVFSFSQRPYWRMRRHWGRVSALVCLPCGISYKQKT